MPCTERAEYYYIIIHSAAVVVVHDVISVKLTHPVWVSRCVYLPAAPVLAGGPAATGQ